MQNGNGLKYFIWWCFFKTFSFITNGKTKNCLKKFNLDDSVIGACTPKDWADDNCILLILDQISK